MTKATNKTQVPSNADPTTIILFGLDEHDKPRAARFTGHGTQLLAKAAAAMKLRHCEAKTADLLEVAKKLPKGRLYSNGRGFVPYVRRDLYDKLVAACDEGTAAVRTTKAGSAATYPRPRNWQEIAPGHLVIMQEGPRLVWWEAIVIERIGDILTLKYRDYPDHEECQRHLATVALMHAAAD